MSFKEKLASFKAAKLMPSSAPPVALAKPPPRSFDALVSAVPPAAALPLAALRVHLREAGGVAALRAVLAAAGRAVASFSSARSLAYAVAHLNGSVLEIGGETAPLRIVVVAIEPGTDPAAVRVPLEEEGVDAASSVRPIPTLLPPRPDLAPFAPGVVVGGVGGSGTRLVALILEELGFSMGQDQNESSDNLAFTLLFKRLAILDCGEGEFDALVTLMAKGAGCSGGGSGGSGGLSAAEFSLLRSVAAEDRLGHPQSWLQERARRIVATAAASSGNRGGGFSGSWGGGWGGPRKWGWKEPNSHVVLDRLAARFPAMKYVHVVRSGLDMAMSENQNQLALWGTHVLGPVAAHAAHAAHGRAASAPGGDGEANPGGFSGMVSPGASLRYWCAVHRRVERLGRRLLGPDR